MKGERASSTLRVPPMSMMGCRKKVRRVGEALVRLRSNGTDPFSSGERSYSNTKFPPNVFFTKLCLH